MIKYTWDIVAVTKKDFPDLGLSDVIVRIMWRKTGTNKSGKSFGFPSETVLVPPTKAGEFTNLDDLSDEDLIEWIKSGLDEWTMNTIDQTIEEKLAEVSTEEVVVPWVSKKAVKKSKKGSK